MSSLSRTPRSSPAQSDSGEVLGNTVPAVQGELSPQRPSQLTSRVTSHITWKSGMDPGAFACHIHPLPLTLSSARFPRQGTKDPKSRKSSLCQLSRCHGTIWDEE